MEEEGNWAHRFTSKDRASSPLSFGGTWHPSLLGQGTVPVDVHQSPAEEGSSLPQQIMELAQGVLVRYQDRQAHPTMHCCWQLDGNLLVEQEYVMEGGVLLAQW